MDNIEIEQLNIDDIESVQEYSKLIIEVMEEFNSNEITESQISFAGITEIIVRKKFSNFHKKYPTENYDGYNTVQFIAKCKEKIIGLLEIEAKCLIQLFYVKKDFQNKGIGRELLNYSIKYFMDEGIKLNYYRVFSSTYAQEIYKSLGFIGDKNELYYYFAEKS